MPMMRIQASSALISTYSFNFYKSSLLLSSRQKLSIFNRPSLSSKFLAQPSHAPMSFAVSLHAKRRFSSQEEAAAEDYASSEDLCFKSPLKIVEYPDPILRARNKRINTFDDRVKELVHEMFDIMYKYQS